MGGSGRKSFWRRTCRSLPHDIQLFLGCTDPLTAEFVSDRTGLASVAVTSKAKQLATFRVTDYTPEYRETSGVGKRPVLTPDEVLRLPIDEALIIVRGMKPLKVSKYDYSLHPEYSKLKNCKASNYVPAWRQKELEDEAAAALDGYSTSRTKASNQKGNKSKDKNKSKKSSNSKGPQSSDSTSGSKPIQKSQPAVPVSSPAQKQQAKQGHIVTTKDALMVDSQ